MKSNSLIILLLLFGVLTLKSQDSDNELWQFIKIQGLSDRFINGVVQDNQGFLWVATWNGLNRYDGYSSKIYKNIDGDTMGLRSNGVRSIKKDATGKIWMLSSNDIYYYNPDKDRIQIFYSAAGENMYIVEIYPDSKGNIWMMTNTDALYRIPLKKYTGFSSNKNQIIKYVHNEKNAQGIEKIIPSFTNVFEDKRGAVWITFGDNKIDKYNSEKDNFEHFQINLQARPADMQYLGGIQLEDNEGLFWISSFGMGVLTWDWKTNKVQQFKYTPGIKNTVSSNITWSIIQDKEGFIWIGTDGGGISLYNKKTKTFQHCTNDPSNSLSFSSDAAKVCFEDRTGVIWIGSQKIGLNKFERNKSKFGLHVSNPFVENSFSNGPVNALLEDKDGDFWIGVDGGGLDMYEKKTGKYHHFVHNPKDPSSLGSNAIVCLAEDREGKIWIGTYAGGLGCYDKKTGKMKCYFHDSKKPGSISHNSVFALTVDSKNRVWAGTLEGILNLYDRKKDRFIKYDNEPGNPLSFKKNYMTHILEDSRNYLWIATNAGMEYIKLNENDFSVPEPKLKFNHFVRTTSKNNTVANNFTVIQEDSDKNMWFGTDGYGIMKLDMKTNKITDYTEAEGLVSNSVRGILEDDEENLWISTQNGLSKLNRQSNKFRNFDINDGLQENLFSRCFFKTRTGKLCFGGLNGYNAFYPSDISFNTNPPKIVFTGLKAFNTPILAGVSYYNTVIISQPVNIVQKIIIPHEVNSFSISFAALDYTSPDKNQYAFMMKGFDENWQYTSSKDRLATYTNLDPGEYVFLVKASNNDNVWTDDPISLNVIIVPPWWQTLWFKLFLYLIIVFFASIIVFWIIRKINREANQSILNERNQLKILINNIPDQVYIKDSKLRYIIVNQAAIEFMGFSNEFDLLHKTSADVFPKEIADEFIKQELEIIKSGKVVVDEENTKGRDDKIQYFLTTRCPIINLKQETIGIVVIVRDITNQKLAEIKITNQAEALQKINSELNQKNILLQESQQQIEEQAEELRTRGEILLEVNDMLVEKQKKIMEQSDQLKMSNEKLSMINATKDKLFSIIAHDLRNPFNGVIGFSDMIIKKIDTLSKDKILKYAEVIHTSSRAANILLENLLQWSQIQTGRLIFDLSPVELLSVVDRVIILHQTEAQRKNITLIKEIKNEIFVIADENMLQTILRNLISNAIKFTPEQGTITIDAKIEGKQIEISVTDTGVGIPKENFDKLFRIDQTVTTHGTANEKGTGLGLLLCKEFVEKQNGKIWIESEIGKGSKFVFSLQLS